MSVDRDTQIWHLTSEGWSRGEDENNRPNGAVKTVVRSKVQMHFSSPWEINDSVYWQSASIEEAHQLCNLFGDFPE